MITPIAASTFAGRVEVPGSKSVSQRAIACAALALGRSELFNAGSGKDVLAALQLARACGARIEKGKSIVITGGGIHPSPDVTAGESGLASRMFLPLLALSDRSVTMHGEGSLALRPFDTLEQILPQLGVRCVSTHGKLPFAICGPIHGGKVTMDGSTSSQFVTGLLMALPLCKEDSEVIVLDAISKPYLQLTLEVMKHFGVKIKHKDLEVFQIPGRQTYRPSIIHIPGDWSSMVNFLVLGALASPLGIEVANPGIGFTQADALSLEVLMSAGVKLQVTKETIKVQKSQIKAFSCDLIHCPDLFPPLAVLAVFADGPCRLAGMHRLIHKESNRAVVIVREFAKAGIRVEMEGDLMIVHPGRPLNVLMDAHHDHRISMAAAIMGSAAEGMGIQHAESVDKSFPDFFKKLDQLRLV